MQARFDRIGWSLRWLRSRDYGGTMHYRHEQDRQADPLYAADERSTWSVQHSRILRAHEGMFPVPYLTTSQTPPAPKVGSVLPNYAETIISRKSRRRATTTVKPKYITASTYG